MSYKINLINFGMINQSEYNLSNFPKPQHLQR